MYCASKVEERSKEGREGAVPIDLLDYYLSLLLRRGRENGAEREFFHLQESRRQNLMREMATERIMESILSLCRGGGSQANIHICQPGDSAVGRRHLSVHKRMGGTPARVSL